MESIPVNELELGLIYHTDRMRSIINELYQVVCYGQAGRNTEQLLGRAKDAVVAYDTWKDRNLKPS